MRLTMMKMTKLKIKDLVDGNGNLTIKGIQGAVIETDEMLIVKRLFIEDCDDVILLGADLCVINNVDNIIPVVIHKSGLITLSQIIVNNSGSTISVLSRANSYFSNIKVFGGTTGIALLHDDQVVRASKIHKQTSDCIFVSANSIQVYDNTIECLGSDSTRGIHPDCIQIAPKAHHDNVLTNIIIQNNLCEASDPSKYPVQGICATEGMLANSLIANNEVNVPNDNSIRVNRASEVVIQSNTVYTDIIIGSSKDTESQNNNITVSDNEAKRLVIYDGGVIKYNENIVKEKLTIFNPDGSIKYDGVYSDNT